MDIYGKEKGRGGERFEIALDLDNEHWILVFCKVIY
jgi:hypothetical protein